MVRKTITSLAIITTFWGHLRKDYIESFVPFIATLIAKKDYKTINISRLCEDFKKEFGLIIPYLPMVTILTRAKSRKLVKRQMGNYVPLKNNIAKYDFTDISREQEKKQGKLIKEFIDFSKKNYGVDLDKDKAESTFISFLRSFDLDILFASQAKSVLPTVKPSKRIKFLLTRFMKHACDSEDEIFKFLVHMAIGHILASALLYGHDLKQFEGKLKNVCFYFDTRFVLRLLGVEGPEKGSVYIDFLKNLRDGGANFFLFRHTYDELMGILESCHKWVENPLYDPSKASMVLRYFVDKGYKQSDVQRYIIIVDELLEESKITVIEPLSPAEHQKYQIDEEKLRAHIVGTYTKLNPNFVEWEKDFTIQRDIHSISAVSKLRRGQKPRNIKKAGHIFITTNSALAYANRRFEDFKKGAPFYIPTCLTDVFVGTIQWLQSPAQVWALNEKKIIADCIAALQPDPTLIKKFIIEVGKLRSERKVSNEEYYSLRSSMVARELLMEKTMGDPDNFTPKTALEILEEMKARIRKEEQLKYLEEKDKREKIEEELKTIKAVKESMEETIERRAEGISNIVSMSVFWILAILSIFGLILQSLPNLLGRGWPWGLSLCVTLIFGAATIVFGANIKGIRDSIRKAIKVKIIRWLKA